MTKAGRVHISDDGAARPCRAQSDESCRAGGDRGHFDSIEEANAHTEKTAREENEAFTALAKPRFTEETTDRYGNTTETGASFNPVMQRSQVAKLMESEINDYLGSHETKASVSVVHEGESIRINIDPHMKDSEAYEIIGNRIVPTKETTKLIKEISARVGKFDRVRRIPREDPLSHFGVKITFLNEEEKALQKVREKRSEINKLNDLADREDWDDARYDEAVTPLINERKEAELEMKARHEMIYLLYKYEDDETVTMESLHEEAQNIVRNLKRRDWWGIETP